MTRQLRVNDKQLHLQCCALDDQQLAFKSETQKVYKYVNTAAMNIFVCFPFLLCKNPDDQPVN